MFYITVKNGLLDPKHIKAMGGDRNIGTIWLFLWFLDKMTIIDHEKGEGKVLGGKPIKFEEVQTDLLISRATYKRWIEMLRNGGYIDTNRTPYGLQVTVYKAFKVFGQKTERRRTSEPSNGASVSHHPPAGEPSNKTIQLRHNSKTLAPIGAGPLVEKKLVTDFIDAFHTVNPSHDRLFSNKTERAAAERLLAKHGVDMMARAIKALPEYLVMPGCPQITTPYQLEKKLGQYVAFAKQKKSKIKIASMPA